MKRIFFLIILPFALFSSLQAQELKLKEIMKGNDFIGHSPDNFRWNDNGQTLFFDWNPDNKPYPELYKVNAKNQVVVKATQEERTQLKVRSKFNKKRTAKTYTLFGDVFFQDEKTRKQITNTSAYESNARFSHDEKSIIYESGNNLYSWNISTGETKQWTNFTSKKKSSGKEKSTQKKWIEDEELELLTIHQRYEARKKYKKENQTENPHKIPEIFIGNESVVSVDLSPNQRFVTYMTSLPNNATRTEVPDYVTRSGYTESLSARPKVGSGLRRYKFYCYDIVNEKKSEIATETLTGIFRLPEHLEAENDSSANRANIVHGPYWNGNGTKALVEIRSTDNKDRWLALLDPKNGELTELEHQRDPAWIAGPGIGWYYLARGNMGWLRDGKHIYFQSEESGWSHLYILNTETGKKTALTSGKYEVSDVQLSRDKKHFYFTASKGDLRQRHFYKMSVSGGQMIQLTQLQGNNSVTLSPDEKILAIRHSYANQPWELYLQPNKPNAKATRITESQSEAFRAYKWREPDFVEFEAEDGAKVPARLYKPEKSNGAAIIFVHGAGYLQNAHKWWSGYYREYMFHNLLADKGYTVLDIDYRASAGYGRNWRTAIYRHMGSKDLSDQVDGAKYLVAKHNIDAKRIGIYGGSYGGFITLMAMFKNGDTFQSGAALRSVTDWAHYNHGYTANILNTPTTDSIAFRRSSPIYFADGLKGELLILHGVVDTNVQFQDVVRLSQRLIELGKKNWNLAVFPKEGHGFRESDSWHDEYRRILELFERTLK